MRTRERREIAYLADLGGAIELRVLVPGEDGSQSYHIPLDKIAVSRLAQESSAALHRVLQREAWITRRGCGAHRGAAKPKTSKKGRNHGEQ